MLHRILSDEPWFHPKKHGYGSGLPCAWQGWVLLLLYIAAATLIGAYVETMGWIVFALALTGITIPFLWLAKRHTKGGWRYRP